jgi:TRAP-type C4-dicarboxylate transport system permease small subunit
MSAQRAWWRRLTAAYARVLGWLLSLSVLALLLPVSLQIFSRYTSVIPSFIWTEEMARFLFIWMVMLGAAVALREGSHFIVDVWPQLRPRWLAASRIVAGLFVLLLAIAFVWWGIEFTQFAWGRSSELAELPLWLIHVAWPVTGASWIVFLGEQMADDLRRVFGQDIQAEPT